MKKEARYYESLAQEKVKCTLCPHNCLLKDEQTGSCHVRKNSGGKLYAENFEKISALHFDPIEKKPLYHYYPGEIIFSVGSVGCNLHCKFCQNAEISQTSVNDFMQLRNIPVNDIVNTALTRPENIGIAYTYNEPIVWFEYMVEIAIKARLEGLKNVVVTNGFINEEPLVELIDNVDAFSIDLKAFTDDFYKKNTFSRLNPVKNTLKIIREANKHLEITNLVIPTLNDDKRIFSEMVQWIAGELGENTILHISKYYPSYKMTIETTPIETMMTLFDIAREKLNYVYIGNISANKGRDTLCSQCGQKVISRDGYWTSVNGLTKDGRCNRCNNAVAIR